jgi:transposase
MPRTIRFHLDENCPAAIAEGLRRRGIDITTTPDAGLLTASDEEQTAYALAEGRVIFTLDKDFLRMNAREALRKHTERIPPISYKLLERCVGDFNRLAERVEECVELIKAQLRDDPVAQKLDTIAGVGPIIATAARASVPDIGQFKNGRHFATSLGLVPQQASSGQTTRLGSMSKRGNPYLRKLLIHSPQGTNAWRDPAGPDA